MQYIVRDIPALFPGLGIPYAYIGVGEELRWYLGG
jgi:hypothetical protein